MPLDLCSESVGSTETVENCSPVIHAVPYLIMVFVPAFQCIDQVKACSKLQLLGFGSSPVPVSGEHISELGRALYKLHFQLVMVLEAANRMVGAVTAVAQAHQVVNRTVFCLLGRSFFHISCWVQYNSFCF